MRIGIVGAGIGGLTAAKVLHENGVNFTLFEKSDYLGGHALSKKIILPSGSEFFVDLGVFMYIPNHSHKKIDKWVGKLHLPKEEAFIDIGYTTKYGAPKGIVASPRYLLDLKTFIKEKFYLIPLSNLQSSWKYGGFFDQLEFGYESNKFFVLAHWVVRSKQFSGMSVATFAKRYNFSKKFIDNYVVPFVCCWWGGTTKDAWASDIQIICDSYNIWSKAPFYIFKQGWQSMPEKIAAKFPERIQTNNAAQKIYRKKNKIIIESEKSSEAFDQVILAAPPGAMRDRLHGFPAANTDILKGYSHTSTKVYLHQDESWLPDTLQKPLLNYSIDKRGKFTTFWFGKLHPEKPKYYLTWGEGLKKLPKDPVGVYDFYRMLPTTMYQKRAREYHSLQGQNGLWYCGAHVFYPSGKNEIPSLWHGDAMYSGFKVGANIVKSLS